jgi:hypothetical protein
MTAVRHPAALLSDDPDRSLVPFWQSAVVQHLEVAPFEQHDAIRARVRALQTRADLLTYLKDVEKLVAATRCAEVGHSRKSRTLRRLARHPIRYCLTNKC